MNRQIKGSLFVFLGACSFGILSTIVKISYDRGFTLGEITGSQALFGVFLLWILYFFQRIFFQNRKKSGSDVLEKKATAWWQVALAGIFSGAVSILYYQCVKLLPASVAIILLMQYIWMTVLLEMFIYRKKPTRIQLLAIVFVLVGTVPAAGVFGDEVVLNAEGIIFGLLSAFAYAVFILVNGRVGNDLPTLKKSALMMTGSCVMIFILFPPVYLFNGVLWNTELLYLGLLLAVFGTFIPPWFFATGVPQAGVALSSILSAAELPVAVLVSHMVLYEPVESLRWTGVFLILASIVLPHLKRLRRR